MEPKQIIVNHENSKHGYIHWLDNENYQLLELERDVYINENKRLNNIIEKVNKYIVANFTNQDGTIWHSEMQNIYNILNNKDN